MSGALGAWGLVVACAGTSDGNKETAERVASDRLAPEESVEPLDETAGAEQLSVAGIDPDSQDRAVGIPAAIEGTFLPADATETPAGEPIIRETSRHFLTSLPWKTNWSIRIIDLADLILGAPRDGIPPLNEPAFISVAEADAIYSDNSPVIQFEVHGDVRAYPLEIMTWHEIVNDMVGGVPVAVTFCPLCNTAIAFQRTVAGSVLTFGTSGVGTQQRLSDVGSPDGEPVAADRRQSIGRGHGGGRAYPSADSDRCLVAIPEPFPRRACAIPGHGLPARLRSPIRTWATTLPAIHRSCSAE